MVATRGLTVYFDVVSPFGYLAYHVLRVSHDVYPSLCQAMADICCRTIPSSHLPR